MTDDQPTEPSSPKELTGRQKSGKAGGEATKEKHGNDHFKKIGKEGGKAKGAEPPPPPPEEP